MSYSWKIQHKWLIKRHSYDIRVNVILKYILLSREISDFFLLLLCCVLVYCVNEGYELILVVMVLM